MTLRKRLVVKNLLCELKNDLVYLQETKLAGVNRQMVCSLWSCLVVCGIIRIWIGLLWIQIIQRVGF